jgi:hypothetical protein
LSGQKLAKWIPPLKRGSARYTFQRSDSISIFQALATGV